MSERIRRILNRKNIRTAFKPLKTLGHVFNESKDRRTKEQLKSGLQNVPVYICWREKKKSRRAEHKPGTNGNIGSAVKQHAETTGHDIHQNYTNILETGVKFKNRRLF